MLAQLAHLRFCALMSLRHYVLVPLCPCALMSLCPDVCALMSAPLCPGPLCPGPFCLRPYVVDRVDRFSRRLLAVDETSYIRNAADHIFLDMKAEY